MKKIAVIGGPASGKTSVMQIIAKAISEEYRAKVAFVSEAAREIIDNNPPEVIEEMTPLVFQFEVYKLQIEKENLVDTSCEYMLCDRGTADAFVYLSEEEATTLLAGTKEELLNQYDVVVFLFGRRKNFINDSNANRKERDYSQIKALEEKTLQIWKSHPCFYAVAQCKTIYKKAFAVAVALNMELGINLFDLSVIEKMEVSNNEEG